MRVVVTGAASGIGRATAKRLAVEGPRWTGQAASLVLVDRDSEGLKTLAAELTNADVITSAGDLADPDTCASVIALSDERFGGLDGLVCNAGIVRYASLLDLTIQEYELTFAINTRSTWLLAKAAYPLLRQSRGAIVATASVAAHEPTIGLGAYAPSKAALLMLVRQMACDWGRDGIRCNTVSPGTTRTNITKLSSEPASTSKRANNPLGIIAEPEDQAAAIAFLLSPDARFINGADILVDGGASSQLMYTSGMAASD